MHPVLNGVLSLAITGVVVSACGSRHSAGSTAQQTPQETATSGPPATAAVASTKVNVDEIFPAGPGRDLLLNNCTTCHTFVPIVVLQMTKEAWERNSRDHRERVTSLGDADFKTLYEYLEANFNPDHAVPKLPKELLATWTSY